MTRPPVGSTGTLAELQVEPGDVVRFVEWHDGFSEAGSFAYGKTYTVMNDIVDSGQGYFRINTPNTFSLISRANPDQPAHIIAHEGRDYDLTALETPPGLLPNEVYYALVTWPHGLIYFSGGFWNEREDPPSRYYGLVVRAKPAPTKARVQCYRGEYYKAKEHGTCIKNPDGKIDWASFVPDVVETDA